MDRISVAATSCVSRSLTLPSRGTQPASSYIAGNTRFVVERQFDYPVTAIRTAHIRRVPTYRNTKFCLLPGTGNGDYAQTLGEAGIENLKKLG